MWNIARSYSFQQKKPFAYRYLFVVIITTALLLCFILMLQRSFFRLRLSEKKEETNECCLYLHLNVNREWSVYAKANMISQFVRRALPKGPEKLTTQQITRRNEAIQ